MISTLNLSQVDCFPPFHITVLLRFLSCSFVWNIFLHSLILSKIVFVLLCMWKVSYVSQLWRSSLLEDISKQHTLSLWHRDQGPVFPWLNYFLCLLIQFLRLWVGNFVASEVCPLVGETGSGPLVARAISSGVVCLEAALGSGSLFSSLSADGWDYAITLYVICPESSQNWSLQVVDWCQRLIPNISLQ